MTVGDTETERAVPWIRPSSATGDPDAPLSASQVSTWRDEGYAVVDGIFPEALVSDLVRELDTLRPGPLNKGIAFPCARAPALNALALHPRLRAAAGQLLQGPTDAEPRPAPPQLRLLQSEAWAKAEVSDAERAGTPFDSRDQRMHMDYPNHMLTHPSPWGSPEAVEAILYLDDEEVCGGVRIQKAEHALTPPPPRRSRARHARAAQATRLVARRGDDDEAYTWPYVRMPGCSGHGWINDRAHAEVRIWRARATWTRRPYA